MFKPKQNFDEIRNLRELSEYQEFPCRLTNSLANLAKSWSFKSDLRLLAEHCDKTHLLSQFESERTVEEAALNLTRVINISVEFISPEKAYDSNAIDIKLRIITEMGWVSESASKKLYCFLNHHSNMERCFKEGHLPPQEWNLDALINLVATSFDSTFFNDLTAFEKNSFNHLKSHISFYSSQTFKTIIKDFYKAGSNLVFPFLGLVFFYSMRNYPELLGQIVLVSLAVGTVLFKFWLKDNWKLLVCFYIPWIILFPIHDPQSVSETTNLFKTLGYVSCANLGVYFLFFSIEFCKTAHETAIEVAVLLSNKNHLFRSLFPFVAPVFVSSVFLIIGGIKLENVPNILFSSISDYFLSNMLFGVFIGYFGYIFLTTSSKNFEPQSNLHLIRSCFSTMTAYVIFFVWFFMVNLPKHYDEFFHSGFDLKIFNGVIQNFAILFLFCIYSTYFYVWWKCYQQRRT